MAESMDSLVDHNQPSLEYSGMLVALVFYELKGKVVKPTHQSNFLVIVICHQRSFFLYSLVIHSCFCFVL